MQGLVKAAPTHARARAHTHTHTHTHTLKHTHPHTRARAHTHTHTHTHGQVRGLEEKAARAAGEFAQGLARAEMEGVVTDEVGKRVKEGRRGSWEERKDKGGKGRLGRF